MDFQNIIFTIAKSFPGFLLAIIIHEYSHGYVAKMFGDDTAEREGRLTFNPAAHIDPMGTIFFPLLGIIMGWAAIGWAKPVPVETRNFKDMRRAIFWVSFAGPLSNFIVGVLSAFLFAVWAVFVPQDFSFYTIFLQMLQYSIFINFLLGMFNLIPFPPLDGSRMLASYLKGDALRKYESLSQYTSWVFIGIFGLSMMGVPTIHYVLTPVISFGQMLPHFFLGIMQ
ncbi:MAG: site-2 protease family protein [Halobacteriovoraceae bacterium]|jgi:Zn-dependent protease|nr:site-2 protease family protein [Halobacteriovoraceae bacterium]